MAGIEGVPAVPQVDLEPGAEVHRVHIGRNADVAQIAVAVTRRDVHAAAEGDGEVREVAADAATLGENVQGRLGRARILVAELHMAEQPAADRLYPRPARWGLPEQVPGDGQHLGHLAVAAPQQERQTLIRQVLDLRLRRVRRDDLVLPAVGHEGLGTKPQPARRGDYPVAAVAEAVYELRHGQFRLGAGPVFAGHPVCLRGVRVEHQQHGGGHGELENDVVADTDKHGWFTG